MLKTGDCCLGAKTQALGIKPVPPPSNPTILTPWLFLPVSPGIWGFLSLGSPARYLHVLLFRCPPAALDLPGARVPPRCISTCHWKGGVGRQPALWQGQCEDRDGKRVVLVTASALAPGGCICSPDSVAQPGGTLPGQSHLCSAEKGWATLRGLQAPLHLRLMCSNQQNANTKKSSKLFVSLLFILNTNCR